MKPDPTREDFARVFAPRLKAARMATGLTQGDAAAMLGVTQERISELERGVRLPSLPRLATMVERLDLDPRILFPEWFGENEEKT